MEQIRTAKSQQADHDGNHFPVNPGKFPPQQQHYDMIVKHKKENVDVEKCNSDSRQPN